MSSGYEKSKIISKLQFLADEPKFETKIFKFDRFAKQLSDLVTDKNTPTPYVIGLHGEWGSGKTSLMGQAFSDTQKKFKKSKDEEVMWFDAWQYEKLDPVASLLYKISIRFNKNSDFKRTVKGLIYIFSDIALRAKTGLSIDEVKKHFEQTAKGMPTITEQLEKMLENRRLIIFIDDLDRCTLENSLRILESIKLFLTAKGMIFVMAVDMKKIEKAWALRYGISNESVQEGKDHVEKIFQLKLGLPPKELESLNQYIEELASSLPPEILNILVNGCPPNPRKIKRILNVIYFISKEIDNTKFNSQFPLIVIWSIITSTHTELARIIEKNPDSLVKMAIIVKRKTFDDLKREREKFKDVIEGKKNLDADGRNIPYNLIHRNTLDGLEWIADNDDLNAFALLQEIAKFYSLELAERQELVKNSLDVMEKQITEPFREVIFNSGLVG